MVEQWLSVDSVAKYLGLSKSMVWKMVWSGTLPSIKIGQSRRVYTQHLREYLRERLAVAGERD